MLYVKKDSTFKCVSQLRTDLWKMIGVQYCKVLQTVTLGANHGVTVAFEHGTTTTGSNVVGADSAKSPTEQSYWVRTIQPSNQRIPHDQSCNKVCGRASSIRAQPSPSHGVLNPS